ncbi:hypothetical protein [Bizionia sp. APA-3]|uniref:hypothetical protein n=1 Tax=Bizionia sp. APA-3 TaxID=1861784 RepID=UPI001E3D9B8C|nr:hypothetical protein [Bizionia sp. APA-3]
MSAPKVKDDASLASPTGIPPVKPTFNQELSGVSSTLSSCAKIGLNPNNNATKN